MHLPAARQVLAQFIDQVGYVVTAGQAIGGNARNLQIHMTGHRIHDLHRQRLIGGAGTGTLQWQEGALDNIAKLQRAKTQRHHDVLPQAETA
ncbi:hypothetical protein D3C80_1943260 [compost metagenome]